MAFFLLLSAPVEFNRNQEAKTWNHFSFATFHDCGVSYVDVVASQVKDSYEWVYCGFDFSLYFVALFDSRFDVVFGFDCVSDYDDEHLAVFFPADFRMESKTRNGYTINVSFDPSFAGG